MRFSNIDEKVRNNFCFFRYLSTVFLYSCFALEASVVIYCSTSSREHTAYASIEEGKQEEEIRLFFYFFWIDHRGRTAPRLMDGYVARYCRPLYLLRPVVGFHRIPLRLNLLIPRRECHTDVVFFVGSRGNNLCFLPVEYG
jgi:hypothetical protein